METGKGLQTDIFLQLHIVILQKYKGNASTAGIVKVFQLKIKKIGHKAENLLLL